MATRSSPPKQPASPRKRTDTRKTLVYKHERFDSEFRALINRAAGKAGMTQSAWVEARLRRAAQLELTGKPEAPDAGLPAVMPSELVQQLAELSAEVRQARERMDRMEAAQQAEAAQRARGFWQRIGERFRGGAS